MNHDDPAYLTCTNAALDHLRRSDPILGCVIDRMRPLRRGIEPDPFIAIVHSVIGQQISGKAQDSIIARAESEFGALNFENLRAISADRLRATGISERKANTIRAVIDQVASGLIQPHKFHTQSDQEIVESLTTIKGIGLWTVEMVLIFSLRRPNVISFKDLGIRRGMEILYQQKPVTREFYDIKAARYAPYATTASLYLWEIAGTGLPVKSDRKSEAND